MAFCAHVPYKGSGPLMTDLMGGQIPVSFDTVVAASQQLKSGKVRVLAVAMALIIAGVVVLNLFSKSTTA